MKTYRAFYIVPTLAGGLLANKTGSAGKLYFDHSLRFRLRLLPLSFKIVPYIEGGFGWISADGIDFQLLGAAGIDFYTFPAGAFGIQAAYQSVLAQKATAIPIVVTFTRRFN